MGAVKTAGSGTLPDASAPSKTLTVGRAAISATVVGGLGEGVLKGTGQGAGGDGVEDVQRGSKRRDWAEMDNATMSVNAKKTWTRGWG